MEGCFPIPLDFSLPIFSRDLVGFDARIEITDYRFKNCLWSLKRPATAAPAVPPPPPPSVATVRGRPQGVLPVGG